MGLGSGVPRPPSQAGFTVLAARKARPPKAIGAWQLRERFCEPSAFGSAMGMILGCDLAPVAPMPARHSRCGHTPRRWTGSCMETGKIARHTAYGRADSDLRRRDIWRQIVSDAADSRYSAWGRDTPSDTMSKTCRRFRPRGKRERRVRQEAEPRRRGGIRRHAVRPFEGGVACERR